MKTVTPYHIVNYKVLSFLMAYLFVAITYVYFLPNYADQVRIHSASSSIYKRESKYQSTQNANYLQRTDKTTLNDKRKDVFVALETTAIAFFLVFLGLNLLRLGQKIRPLQTRLFYNQQYAYIPLCTFRI